jgi:hypothetical protein
MIFIQALGEALLGLVLSMGYFAGFIFLIVVAYGVVYGICLGINKISDLQHDNN